MNTHTNTLLITAADHHQLEIFRWLPKTKPANTIVLSHGMGEHLVAIGYSFANVWREILPSMVPITVDMVRALKL